MTRRILPILMCALLVAGCTQSDWDYFWAEEGDWSRARPTSTLYQTGVSTGRQCRAIGGTWGAQGCWRL